jgi:NTP pyrophosphatase (non-canonical NTP hydrolase)
LGSWNIVFVQFSAGREVSNVVNDLILRKSFQNFVMTIQQAQQQVDQWIKTTGVRYFSELTNMAILTEEVGEVARLMSRLYGDQSFKESDKQKQLSDELADVLWVLICIANQTGVDLTDALQKNFEKKTARDSQRHQQNKKLNL